MFVLRGGLEDGGWASGSGLGVLNWVGFGQEFVLGFQ